MRSKITTTYLGVLASASLLLASSALAGVAGSVTSLSGKAEVQESGAGAWKPLSMNSEISVGDHVRTGAGSALTVTYADGSVIALESESELVIDEQSLPSSGPQVSLFSLNRGKLDVAVPKGQYDKPGARFEVKTTT